MILWLIGFADVSGDYAVFAGVTMFSPESPVPQLRQQTQLASTALIGLLAVLGVWSLIRGKCKYQAGPDIQLFYLLLAASTIWGVLVGIANGVPINFVIGDSQNVLSYLMVLAVGIADSDERVESLRRLFYIGCGILVLKLLYSYGLNLAMWGSLSWRSLFKLSNFFLPMLFTALASLMYMPKTRLKDYSVAMVAAFGIFASQTRGYFLGTLAGAMFFGVMSLNNRRFYRVFLSGVVILAIGLVAGLALQGDITKSFGYWERTDETFAPGFEYRLRQSDALLLRFGDNWLWGTGLGSYDPTYEGYQDWLPRPYLAELEYHNLLAKLGLVGSTLWAGAFFFLLVGCIQTVRKAINPEHRGFALGLTTGLVGLMTASAVQTSYSSVYFHLFVVLLLLILSSVRTRRAGTIQAQSRLPLDATAG